MLNTFKPSEALSLSLTVEQIDTLNKKGYVSLTMQDSVMMDVTLNEKGEYVQPQKFLENEVPEQNKNVTKAMDVIWHPQHNGIHADLRVTHVSNFNNGKFFVGMTEAGHYSMFYKVVGKLHDNIKLDANTLQEALEEASIKALIITYR